MARKKATTNKTAKKKQPVKRKAAAKNVKHEKGTLKEEDLKVKQKTVEAKPTAEVGKEVKGPEPDKEILEGDSVKEVNVPQTEGNSLDVEEVEDIEVNIDEVDKKEEDADVLFLKSKRLEVDELIVYSKKAYGAKSDVFNSLFAGKSWLGKCLAELGTINPYKTKKAIVYKTEIPATVDVFEDISKISSFGLLGEIQKISFLRDRLEILKRDLRKELEVEGMDSFLRNALLQSYNNLVEARFELGYLLSEIRNR